MAFSGHAWIRHRPRRLGIPILLVLHRGLPWHDRTDRMVLAAASTGGGAMTPARTLDVSGLPPFEISSRSPLFWGQLLLCAIEGAVLLILIAMYFYYRLDRKSTRLNSSHRCISY